MLVATESLFWLILCVDVTWAATINLNWFRQVSDQGTTTINQGDTVTWTWTENRAHTVTSTGNFDSGRQMSGSFSWTFDTAGSYSYFCSLHTSMKGVIEVIDTTPTANPTYKPTAVPTLTEEPTSPTAGPTRLPTSPTAEPTAVPTVDYSMYLMNNTLIEPQVISSGLNASTAWSATLHVREYRHDNGKVAFNTRAYCYNDVCSHPGPTIVLTPGDQFNLTLVNELGSEWDGIHEHNTMHAPNNTNIHTHGLHIDSAIDSIFVTVSPGESWTYVYELPVDHAPGLHWYHAHFHGSSSMQLMGGLAGAMIVQPLANATNVQENEDNVPTSITESESYLLAVTHLVFEQATSAGLVTQGCGEGFVCDPMVQAPLCYGNETSSPYDIFRIYSLPELSADTGSTMNINPWFNDSQRDFLLVNGQYQPGIEIVKGSPVILRVLHAAGGAPLPLSMSDSSVCNMSVIAWDGVYLNARLDQTVVNMVAASRVDIEVTCGEDGLFELQSSGETLLNLVVLSASRSGMPMKSKVTSEELASILRPWYLSDLQGDAIVIDSRYQVSINQDDKNHSVCGFWLGVGTNCSAQNEAEDECAFAEYYGERGLAASPYITADKLVTFTGAINEWTLYGQGSAFHPLHIHVNHFQIISSAPAAAGGDDYYRPGQWRDTIPPVADRLVFRFVAADFTGETVMHCHFQRHEDLGMMDTFLVTDPDTYAAIHSQAPTPTPTATVAPSLVPTLVPSSTAAPSASFSPTTVTPTCQPSTAPSAAPTLLAEVVSSSSTGGDNMLVIGLSVGAILVLLAGFVACYYAKEAHTSLVYRNDYKTANASDSPASGGITTAVVMATPVVAALNDDVESAQRSHSGAAPPPPPQQQQRQRFQKQQRRKQQPEQSQQPTQSATVQKGKRAVKAEEIGERRKKKSNGKRMVSPSA